MVPRSRRVVVVDDHGMIAESVSTVLATEELEVTVLDPTRVDELRAAIFDAAPDLVLLDLDLGEAGQGDGLILPLVTAGFAVLVLTGVRDPLRAARCLRDGAAGIVDKAGSLERLVDAVHRALDGRPLIDAHVRTELLASLRRHEEERRRSLEPFGSLTRREAEVLGELMQGASVEEVAERSFVSVATVRSQVHAVLRKLGVRSQVAAIARAHEAGWAPPQAAWIRH